jgi:hypothetical protein
MRDRSTTEGRKTGGASSGGSLVLSARGQLEPLLVALIDALADKGDTASFFAAGGFVQDLLERLRTLETDPELLHLMLDISLISFQGFELSDPASRAVESLLTACDSMTQSMTAGNQPD